MSHMKTSHTITMPVSNKYKQKINGLQINE